MSHGVHPDPDAGRGTCSGGPTDAHTIQKEGGLRAIAENEVLRRIQVDLDYAEARLHVRA